MPGPGELLADRLGRCTSDLEKRRLRVVPDLHLAQDERQHRGAKVDLSAGQSRVASALDLADRLLGAEDSLECIALVDGRHGLRAVGEPAAREEADRRLLSRGDVAQPVALLDERAASSDRQGHEDVQGDEPETLHRDRGAGRDGPRIPADRIRPGEVRRICVGLEVVGVARGQDDVVDVEAVPVRQLDALAPVALRLDVDCFDTVVDDLHLGRRRLDEGGVEPLQVLAHDPSREVVVGRDLAPGRVDPAGVAHPAVADRGHPLVEADRVRRRRPVVLPRVQRDLTAGRVEDQEVGLVDGIDPRAGRIGLDDVHAHRTPSGSRFGHDALEHAHAPRTQTDDRELHQWPPVPDRPSPATAPSGAPCPRSSTALYSTSRDPLATSLPRSPAAPTGTAERMKGIDRILAKRLLRHPGQHGRCPFDSARYHGRPCLPRSCTGLISTRRS